MKIINDNTSLGKIILNDTDMKNLERGDILIGDGLEVMFKSMTLKEKYQDAREMINQVYEIIEVWNASAIGTDYGKEVKKEWLRKAREIHGADPMP